MTPWLILAFTAGWTISGAIRKLAFRWALNSDHPKAVEIRRKLRRKLDTP